MHLYPLVSSHTNMMHTLPAVLKLCSIYFSVRPTQLKQGSLFHTSLQSPVHQCKIPHPCRQRQMEGAAPAPCSAPVIYATVAKTHMHAHTHTYASTHTVCMWSYISRWGRMHEYTHTHTQSWMHDGTCLVLMLNATTRGLFKRTCASLKQWQQSLTSFVPFYDS